MRILKLIFLRIFVPLLTVAILVCGYFLPTMIFAEDDKKLEKTEKTYDGQAVALNVKKDEFGARLRSFGNIYTSYMNVSISSDWNLSENDARIAAEEIMLKLGASKTQLDNLVVNVTSVQCANSGVTDVYQYWEVDYTERDWYYGTEETRDGYYPRYFCLLIDDDSGKMLGFYGAARLLDNIKGYPLEFCEHLVNHMVDYYGVEGWHYRDVVSETDYPWVEIDDKIEYARSSLEEGKTGTSDLYLSAGDVDLDSEDGNFSIQFNIDNYLRAEFTKRSAQVGNRQVTEPYFFSRTEDTYSYQEGEVWGGGYSEASEGDASEEATEDSTGLDDSEPE